MKRKKWSEKEEQTLLSKYAELQNNGTLSKLKTREKKFKPIAEHLNNTHHLQDPVSFPFKWSWRDVSIKVQNMRHQYLGVKQKIKVSEGEFHWSDGEHHWENFLKYKEVFGDVELGVGKDCGFKRWDFDGEVFGDFGFEFDGEEGGSGESEGDGEESEGEGGEREEEGERRGKRKRKRRKMAMVGARVLELRDVLVRREEKRREREFEREEGEGARRLGVGGEEIEGEREMGMEEVGMGWTRREFEREEGEGSRVRGEVGGREEREMEMEEMRMRWARREFERREREEREREEERRWRMKVEERREEEEMEWRERMLGLQIEHEKQMMQMFADACQNQMQILGMMARFMCQFFGSATDGLGGGLGGLPPQVLQNLQHPGPGELGDNCKPESNSPPEFL